MRNKNYIAVLFVLLHVCFAAEAQQGAAILLKMKDAYRDINQVHLHISSSSYANHTLAFKQKSDIYRKDMLFRVQYEDVDLYMNDKFVLMLMNEDKEAVIRPISEKEVGYLKQGEILAKNLSLPEVPDSVIVSETDTHYILLFTSPSAGIVTSSYVINKKSYLLEQITNVYSKDITGQENSKVVINYTYSFEPVQASVFDASKIVTSTGKSFTLTQAYNTYNLRIHNPYEE